MHIVRTLLSITFTLLMLSSCRGDLGLSSNTRTGTDGGVATNDADSGSGSKENTCPAGFYGTDCDQECECANGQICDEGSKGTGACSCPSGFYSNDCSQKCDCGDNGTCDDGIKGTGACSCKDNFYNMTCTDACDCQNEGTCNDGTTGDGACTCATDHYSANCSETCDCQNGASCNDGAAGNGACTCTTNFYGTNCANACNCQNGASCNDGAAGNGACTCAPNFYGANCANACSCQANSTCDDGAAGTGSCTCNTGYTQCSSTCVLSSSIVSDDIKQVAYNGYKSTLSELGQSWTATKTGLLHAITVYAFWVNGFPSGTNFNFPLTIRSSATITGAGESAVFGGTPIHSQTAVLTTSSAFDEDAATTFLLNAPVAITAGGVYSFELEKPSNLTTQSMLFANTTSGGFGNIYAGGRSWESDGTDMMFKIEIADCP